MDVFQSIANQTNVKAKILIVDDQPTNIRVLHEILKNNYEVFMAADGFQAIKKANEIQPDLVLLDIEMPGIDGYEVCRRLKSDANTSEIPIIFVTSHFNEASEVMGFELGAVDFIHKPINPIITNVRISNQILLSKQKKMLRTLALVDGLTGIANRRQFNENLIKNWAQCARNENQISLIMIDVDFFKLYNDSLGHQAGDECLKLVAKEIQNSLNRPFDLAARYGGEEFACILPDTDPEGAKFIADNILHSIQALSLPHLSSLIDKIVTVSIGVATVSPTTSTTPTDLIIAADEQLYKSKVNGRNRVSSIVM